MRRRLLRSDTELLKRSLSDAEAFAEFYRRHERAVLGYFMHWCREPELAADLMSETFAAALESVGRYRPGLGDPSAWLFGIGRHVLLRSLRRGRVENETRQRLGMGILVLDDEALERVEAIASVDGAAAAALDGLSGVLRDAVAGRVVEEREYCELARALECSPSVVRQRVRRGLAQMREHLGAPR